MRAHDITPRGYSLTNYKSVGRCNCHGIIETAASFSTGRVVFTLSSHVFLLPRTTVGSYILLKGCSSDVSLNRQRTRWICYMYFFRDGDHKSGYALRSLGQDRVPAPPQIILQAETIELLKVQVAGTIEKIDRQDFRCKTRDSSNLHLCGTRP